MPHATAKRQFTANPAVLHEPRLIGLDDHVHAKATLVEGLFGANSLSLVRVEVVKREPSITAPA
jgi:hypothetical protein